MKTKYNIAEVMKKWSNSEELGRLSIKDLPEDMQEPMATLLENQESIDFNGDDILNEAQFSNSIGSISQLDHGSAYKPIALALVRRTFPALFANKVVGVQAMSTPVGLAYALRIIYANISGGNVGPEAAWDQVPIYSGFTGSTSGTSATYNTSGAGTGVFTSAGEAWQIGTDYPQLKLQLEQVAIVAKTRKLAASFSLEAAQDIRAMHNLDIEREIVNVLQYEIIAELDRELIGKLKTTAVTGTGGAAAIALDLEVSASQTGYVDGRWSQEQLASMVTSIIHQANKIATSTRRGAGNFVIVSPTVATALQSVRPAFSGNDASVNPTQAGVAQIGTLNGSITVYRDQYATDDYALVGYKGAGQNDCGVIYSPYVTGVLNRTVAQEDFSPRIGVMSRYAITDSLLGSGRYYRLMTFANMDKVVAGA